MEADIILASPTAKGSRRASIKRYTCGLWWGLDISPIPRTPPLGTRLNLLARRYVIGRR